MSSAAYELPEHQTREKKSRNPLQSGIWSFITASRVSQDDSFSGLTLQHLPKRFTLYPPLLLLSVNFAAHGTLWRELFSSLDARQKTELFASVADAFTKTGHAVTHVAINAPIDTLSLSDDASSAQDNVLRSPSNLTPVYGNFGPSVLLESASKLPSPRDFEAALWVSTSQSRNVNQIWAPRWTMFSRGNVSEKTRILQGREDPSLFPGLVESQLGQQLGDVDVVDMYIGIGYFAFSYLANGVRRVYGWDLNPWSIEGLRRGCEANGWRCVVVQMRDDGGMDSISMDQLVGLLSDKEIVRCVAFCGDNKWAASVMSSIDEAFQAQTPPVPKSNVRHVNLGLLPSSRNSWESALTVINGALGAWLHVHENVDVRQTASSTQQIVSVMSTLLKIQGRGSWQVECQQVADVKTYAPGVMHCVFDIWARPSSHPNRKATAS